MTVTIECLTRYQAKSCPAPRNFGARDCESQTNRLHGSNEERKRTYSCACTLLPLRIRHGNVDFAAGHGPYCRVVSTLASWHLDTCVTTNIVHEHQH